MSTLVNITGLDKAEVLLALFNNSKQQGLGFLDGRGAQPMTIEQAKTIVKGQTCFDYLLGRVMKVDISGDSFDPWAYDRDNGQGAAARAVAKVSQS